MKILCKSIHGEHFNLALLRKIKEGNNEYLLSIFQHANPSNLIDSTGHSLLHIAASHGNSWLAEYVIKLGANVNAQNHWKKTPLMFAVKNEKVEIVTILLKANADIFVVDPMGESCLQKALSDMRHMSYIGDEHLLRTKLVISKNIAYAFKDLVLNGSLNNNVYLMSKKFHTDCPLYKFVLLNNAEVIKFLLEKSSPVDAMDAETRETALHVAVRQLDMKIVKVLVQYNADVNLKKCNGATPIFCLQDFSALYKVLEIAETLISAGVNLIDYKENIKLIEILLSYGNRKIIRKILKHKIDLNFKDKEGCTPLHYLAKNKNPDVLTELTNFVFDIDVCNKSGYSMLHFAAEIRNLSSIKFLLNRGADVNAKCSNGSTPLSLIILSNVYYPMNRCIQCTDILLAHGADPRIEFEQIDWEYIKSFDWIFEAFVEVMIPVVVHLCSYEISGQDIGQHAWDILQRIPRLRKIFNLKKIECTEMKGFELDASVMLLDFFMASDTNMLLYARNQTFELISFDEIKTLSLDSSYRMKLLVNINKLTTLIRFRKDCATAINNIFIHLYNTSVYEIAEDIMNYLEYREILKFLHSLCNNE